ncbi:serine/threonine protein kinase [Schlesneria paludicola]|uniref:serine/threonine protein kinase n=1 Tax=Schlesneria paludicola TaxID=360056 RepID=UPI0012F71185|nr:serine/threonine-protein kinase [Schlesneria paludicola]
MHFLSLQNFQNYLTKSKLVESPQLQECMVRLQSRGQSIDGLIQELENRHLLTPYQIAKLRKRDLEGLLLGRFKLLYRNASGSFARVFRGCSVDDGKMVGIKVLRSRWAEDPRKVALFKREGELGKRLKHKNIVPIYEVGSDGNQHYLTMEFVEGGNLRELLKARGKFSPEEATRYAIDIAEGLEYALSVGLTHRDMKLTNVLLSAQGIAKLVDFGLAGQDASMKSIDDEVDRAVEYATLERGSGAPDNDPRSDLYFLGAIFYELLSGKPPYTPSKNKEDRRQYSRYSDVRPLCEVDPSLPLNLTRIVDQLLCVNPFDRYQTPTELLRDLRATLGDQAPTGDNSSQAAGKSTSPTVLCVEERIRHQDSLRQYFSKHGYRVLMLGDFQRALTRLRTDTPKGLVLMGATLGADAEAQFEQALSVCRSSGTSVVFVLSKHQLDLVPKIANTAHSRILSDHPVTLRSIRQAFEEMWNV